MKTLKLPIILDTIFIYFISFFFFYALILYGIGGYTLSILLSSTISVVIASGFIIFASIKNDLSYLKESEKQNIKNFNYNLYFTPKNEILEFLNSCYSKQNKKVTVYENYLIIDDDNCQIVPIIKPEEISLSDVIWAVNNSQKGLKIKILGVNFNEKLSEFINEIGLNVEIMKSEDLFFMLKKENIEILSIEINPIPKKRLLKYLKQVFTKKQSKRFIIAGLIITSLSYFSLYPLYYLIFGGTLIFIGTYLKLFKKT